MIIIGGVIGTLLGIITFTFKETGKLSLIISLSYVSTRDHRNLNAHQGASEIDRARKQIILKKLHTHYWIHGLPLKRFKNQDYMKAPLHQSFLEFLLDL